MNKKLVKLKDRIDQIRFLLAAPESATDLKSAMYLVRDVAFDMEIANLLEDLVQMDDLRSKSKVEPLSAENTLPS